MERSDPKANRADWPTAHRSAKYRIMKTLYATILALSIIFAGLAAEAHETSTELSTEPLIATRQWKVGLGPASADQLNVNRSGILYTLGVAWGVQENVDLDLVVRTATFEKVGESGAHFSELLFGTTYYLSGRFLSAVPNAAFLSFAVGRAWAAVSTSGPGLVSDDQVNGWSARLGLGCKFFRSQTVNLGLELNHSKLLAETFRSKNSPGLTSLALALYY